MTKRYPLRSAFRSRNPRNPRHLQRIPLGISQSLRTAASTRGDIFTKACATCRPLTHSLAVNIHHPRFSALVVSAKVSFTIEISKMRRHFFNISGAFVVPGFSPALSSTANTGCAAKLTTARNVHRAARRPNRSHASKSAPVHPPHPSLRRHHHRQFACAIATTSPDLATQNAKLRRLIKPM